MDLLEIRGRLDQIDTQIEKLFEERMRLCSEVAEYKIATGKAVYDAEREKQKIESVRWRSLKQPENAWCSRD